MNLDKKISRIESIHNYIILRPYRNQAPKYRPVFVLGAPRCGSTLFYQAMVHRCKFAYFQNRMMKRIFSVASCTKRHIDPDEVYTSTFENELGMTFDAAGPNEGSVFWRRFYPRNIHDYIPEHSLSERHTGEITGTVAFLTDHFNSSFFSKNLEMSLRLNSIQNMFPDALYIIFKRDPRSIAASILNARLKAFGSKETWWSMRPKRYEQLLKKPYFEQIAYQVADIYNTIHEDLNTPALAIEMYYEDFCEAPEAQTDKIIDFLKSNGAEINSAQNTALPSAFPFKTSFPFEDEELNRIEKIYEEESLPNILTYKITR